MKTDELVTLLATGAEPVDARAPLRRGALAVGAGVLMGAVLMVLWLGARATLLQEFALPMLWAKFGFVAALAAAGWMAVARLGRPGATLAGVVPALIAPVAAMWVLAVVALYGAAPPERATLVLGETWQGCPFNIAILSTPILVASLWMLRGFAPTRPALAGAAAGFFAGAAGALVYAFHCPELAAPFLAIWYLLGMLIPAALGAVVGPFVLRW